MPTSQNVNMANSTRSEEPNNEYDEAERNYNLCSPKFWIIVLGMYLAIFLVALVNLPNLTI